MTRVQRQLYCVAALGLLASCKAPTELFVES